MEDLQLHRALTDMVEKATDKRGFDLDLDVLRRLKHACQKAEEAIPIVFALVMERLRTTHARVRLHAVSLADELFMRSKNFRTLIAQDFPEFLELSTGFKQAKPLPGPTEAAVQLRERTLEAIERWTEKFGSIYPQVAMGHDYLKNVVKLKFPELRARAAAAEAQAQAREARSREINQERYGVIQNDYVPTMAEIEVLLEEMETAFRLLEGRPESLRPDKEDEDDWEDVEGTALDGTTIIYDEDDDKAGLSTSTPAKPTLRNPDPAVMDVLRGSYKLLQNRHLPTILDWLRVIIKVDVGTPGSAEHSRRERILRGCISARDRLAQAKAHYDSLMTSAQTAAMASAEQLLVVSASKGGEISVRRLGQGTDATSAGMAAAAAQEAAIRRKAASRRDSTTKNKREPMPASASPRPAPASGEADLLADVFGSDESDEEPSHSRSRPKQGAKLPGGGIAPPALHDPTYRRPPLALQGDPKSKMSPEAAVSSKGALCTSAEAREQARKSALSEETRRKLLEEAPKIPGGNHLAYWDSDKASLLNNKGMEVYNHWGAVDAHVTLPDHVISQFFSTRASYYDPGEGKRTAKRVREQPQEDDSLQDDLPPAKKPPQVVKIGTASRLPSIPLGRPSIASAAIAHSTPAAASTSHNSVAQGSSLAPGGAPAASVSPLGNAAGGSGSAHAVSSRLGTGMYPIPLPARKPRSEPRLSVKPAPTSAPETALSPAAESAAQGAAEEALMDSEARGEATEHSKSGGRGIGGRSAATGKQPKTGRGGGRKGRQGEVGSAEERAQVHAHNAAILGAAAMTDEDLARDLAQQELQESRGDGGKEGRGRGKEKRGTVRERLARKLLGNRATARAAEELGDIEGQTFRDVHGHAWQIK